MITQTINLRRKPKLAPLKLSLNKSQREFCREMNRQEALVRKAKIHKLPPTIEQSEDGTKTGDSNEPERAPVSSRGSDVRAEVSPAPTDGVSRAVSRPSTQATVRDGILVRWDGDNNPMLRRPRTSSSDGSASNRSSAKITKARFNVVVRKQKVTGLVAALTAASKEVRSATPEKTAAELNYEAAHDPSHPFRHDKQQVLRQYHLQNGLQISQMDLPPLSSEKPTKRAGDPFTQENEAVRQLTINHTKGYYSPRKINLPAGDFTCRSSHVHNTAFKTGYRNKNRRYSALDEYKRITAMESLMKDDSGADQAHSENIAKPESSSVKTFCKTLRPQTAAPRICVPSEPAPPVEGTNRLRRATSCVPKLRFQNKENYYNPDSRQTDNQSHRSQSKETKRSVFPQSTLTTTQSLPSRSASARSHRSCWLSPLEMTNVPADVKLKYIADSEKKRFRKIMNYTAYLMRNENSALDYQDKLARKLMEYKPELDPSKAENESEAAPQDVRQWAHSELSKLLDSAKDDPLLQKILSHVVESAEAKRPHSSVEARQAQGCANSHSSEAESSKRKSVDPMLLGSQTSKSLIAGFYMLLRG